MKRLDNKGSILLVSMVVLYMIMLTASNFSIANFNELNYSRQYYHSTAAFWLAEAGVNLYMADPNILNGYSQGEITYANGKVSLSIDDSHPMFRYINATGIYGKYRRTVQIAYPANVPDAYTHSISTNGDINITGAMAKVVINGVTRITGTLKGASTNANILIEDIQEHVAPGLTGLNFSNDKDKAKSSFIDTNKSLVASYPPQDILYLKDTNSVTLTPDMVKGKKIVYVESESGSGDVTINGNDLVAENQDLTVIASGNVNFNQKGLQSKNSTLNIIAYGDYNETVGASSSYHGIIYTHGVAKFDQIKADSVTTGNIIADGGVVLGDIWSTKVFNYADMTTSGLYPPGFEQMSGDSTVSVGTKPVAWREIVN